MHGESFLACSRWSASQARLKALKANLSKQPALVGYREAPFGVVVVAVGGRGLAPPVGGGCVGEKTGGLETTSAEEDVCFGIGKPVVMLDFRQ